MVCCMYGLLYGWSVVRMVCCTDGLLYGWFVVHMVCCTDGLLYGWSVVRMVCCMDGLCCRGLYQDPFLAAAYSERLQLNVSRV